MSKSHTERANILLVFVAITDVNINVRNWNDIFSNISSSVSSSSIYTDEVSISSTEYFQFVHRFDGRIETMK